MNAFHHEPDDNVFIAWTASSFGIERGSFKPDTLYWRGKWFIDRNRGRDRVRRAGITVSLLGCTQIRTSMYFIEYNTSYLFIYSLRQFIGWQTPATPGGLKGQNPSTKPISPHPTIRLAIWWALYCSGILKPIGWTISSETYERMSEHWGGGRESYLCRWGWYLMRSGKPLGCNYRYEVMGHNSKDNRE